MGDMILNLKLMCTDNTTVVWLYINPFCAILSSDPTLLGWVIYQHPHHEEWTGYDGELGESFGKVTHPWLLLPVDEHIISFAF